MLLPHQERVVAEHADLGAKLQGLNTFLASAAVGSIDPDERQLLATQAMHMTGYWLTLGKRIALWKPTA